MEKFKFILLKIIMALAGVTIILASIMNVVKRRNSFIGKFYISVTIEDIALLIAGIIVLIMALLFKRKKDPYRNFLK